MIKLASLPVLGGYLGASVSQKKPITERHRNGADTGMEQTQGEADMSHPGPRELESSYFFSKALLPQCPFSCVLLLKLP